MGRSLKSSLLLRLTSPHVRPFIWQWGSPAIIGNAVRALIFRVPKGHLPQDLENTKVSDSCDYVLTSVDTMWLPVYMEPALFSSPSHILYLAHKALSFDRFLSLVPKELLDSSATLFRSSLKSYRIDLPRPFTKPLRHVAPQCLLSHSSTYRPHQRPLCVSTTFGESF